MIKLLEIRKSKISGKGVYALKNIKKGTLIGLMTGKEVTLDKMIYNVDNDLEGSSDPFQIDDGLYIDLDELPRCINHSCNPNCCIQGKNKLVAITNIKKDDEITYDYSTTMNDNEEKIGKKYLWTCKCKCGSKNCRKIINQFKTLPKKTKEFYLKNKYLPDFILKKVSSLVPTSK